MFSTRSLQHGSFVTSEVPVVLFSPEQPWLFKWSNILILDISFSYRYLSFPFIYPFLSLRLVLTNSFLRLEGTIRSCTLQFVTYIGVCA
jgi:hypothetical protein